MSENLKEEIVREAERVDLIVMLKCIFKREDGLTFDVIRTQQFAIIIVWDIYYLASLHETNKKHTRCRSCRFNYAI